MCESTQKLNRQLNSRERRRCNLYGMLPVDAIDPQFSIRELFDANEMKFLYRYGCKLEEMNLEQQINSVIVKRNFFFHLRGSHRQFPISVITRLIKSRSVLY